MHLTIQIQTNYKIYYQYYRIARPQAPMKQAISCTDSCLYERPSADR